MESKAKFMCVLAMSMCLILAHQGGAEAEEELKGKPLIQSICKDRGNTEFCEKILLSDPSSSTADLKDLIMITLEEAKSTAANILTDARKMIDEPDLIPAYQQGVSDCKQNLLDAQAQLQDTTASILYDDKLDAQVWLQSALAAIDTCDDSIPGDDDILSKRSVEFRQLCNIAVAINKAMMGIKSSPNSHSKHN